MTRPTGPTTAKELFQNQMADAILRECRRRRTGKDCVYRDVVRVVNRLRDEECHMYTYGLVEKPEHQQERL